MVIKEIEKLLKLCRKQGVTEFTSSDIAFKLGELPTKHLVNEITDEESMFQDFPDGPLSPEELTYFASGGNPQDNPYRRDDN